LIQVPLIIFCHIYLLRLEGPATPRSACRVSVRLHNVAFGRLMDLIPQKSILVLLSSVEIGVCGWQSQIISAKSHSRQVTTTVRNRQRFTYVSLTHLSQYHCTDRSGWILLQMWTAAGRWLALRLTLSLCPFCESRAPLTSDHSPLTPGLRRQSPSPGKFLMGRPGFHFLQSM
jgi:hypothetical protein